MGFEAILGAFVAAVLVRTLDPEPELAHPRCPVTMDAIGLGLLIPVFFATSGMTLGITGLIENPSALAGVPLGVAALLPIRGLPVAAFRREPPRAPLAAVSLLQATALPFLLIVSQIGIEMGLLERTTTAALVAAGVVSVFLFPPIALRLLAGRLQSSSGGALKLPIRSAEPSGATLYRRPAGQ